MINKYRSAMERVKVSSEMEKRILDNILVKNKYESDEKKQTNLNWYKYIGAIAACFIIAFSGITIYFFINQESKKQQTASIAENTQENNAQQEGLQSNLSSNSPSTDKTEPIDTEKDNKTPAAASNTQQENHQSESASNSGVTNSIQNEQQDKLTENTEDISIQQQGEQQKQAAGVLGDTGKNSTVQKEQEISTPSSTKNTGDTDSKQGIQVASGYNPINNIKDIAELRKAVSYKLRLPTILPIGYKIEDISVISGNLVQIIYTNVNDKITFRTAIGSNDVSGDYNVYEETSISNVGKIAVTIKGSKTLVSITTWEADSCSYSLSFSNGIDKKAALTIIENTQ